MSTWSIGFRSLKRRRLRTVLTVLGVVAGVTMMVFLMALAQGMDYQLAEGIRRMGGADMLVFNATTPAPIPHELVITPVGTLNESYAEVLKNISGVYMVSSSLVVNGFVNGTECTINGITPNTYDVVTVGLNMISGRSLQENDDRAVVLGKALSNSLDASIGDIVSIGTVANRSQDYTVVGIFETGSLYMNKFCYMRLDAAQNLTEQRGLVSVILVKCTNPDEVDYVASIISGRVEGVRVFVQRSMVQQASDMRITLGVFIGLVGLAAFSAGSFGVINTTMMSMFERTREIGILKAVGARNSTILKIFWTEAFIIGLLGGAVGCLTGTVAAYAIPMISKHMGGMATFIIITPTILGVSFAIGLTVCILAGLYPAWRASRMKTVEALRNG